jgi:hypothetical protein
VRSEILSGWKDIANYLGSGVRTVQRYEQELGLPVHRPAGKKQGSVIATKSELDAWIESRRFTKHPQLPVVSVLSVCASLKNRAAEMCELANRTKKLILELRASGEMLRSTVRGVHDEVDAGRNKKKANRRFYGVPAATPVIVGITRREPRYCRSSQMIPSTFLFFPGICTGFKRNAPRSVVHRCAAR